MIVYFSGFVEIICMMRSLTIINHKIRGDLMFNINENELIKFTITAFKVVKKSSPAYSSKYSKQKYT